MRNMKNKNTINFRQKTIFLKTKKIKKIKIRIKIIFSCFAFFSKIILSGIFIFLLSFFTSKKSVFNAKNQNSKKHFSEKFATTMTPALKKQQNPTRSLMATNLEKSAGASRLALWRNSKQILGRNLNSRFHFLALKTDFFWSRKITKQRKSHLVSFFC